MAGLNRIMDQSVFKRSSLVLIPSSQQAQLPATHLQDQLLQEVWQTQGPFVVTADNQFLDFNRGGVKLATIALGTYATGALLAAAVLAALNAADPPFVGLTWAVDYNVAAPFKFRIRNTHGVPVGFNLLNGSGANAWRSIATDMGWSAVDTGAVTTTTANTVSYQSRHFLTWYDSDLSSISASVFIMAQHTATLFTLSRVTLQGNNALSFNAPIFSVDIVSLGSPPPDPARVYFASQSQPYWRLVINDIQNPIGYFAMGVPYHGDYVSLDTCCSDSLAFEGQDFSQRMDSISGAGFQNEEPDRETFALEWTELSQTSTDYVNLEDFNRRTPVGRNFFFDFDHTVVGGFGTGRSVFYVCKAAGRRRSWVPSDYYTLAFPLVEQI